ncbi:MAG: glycoside hydrolase family 127 protein [Lachnospiraceae bacterium]|nr:glycoside hydrolase family 127 protein [Lachnospiraceae bacterium]
MMNANHFSTPMDLKNIKVTDEFWHREQEVVRTGMLPYQWEALNDRVEGAAPSFCMHNFRAAGRLMKRKREQGVHFKEPVYTFRGFETLPEDGKVDPDRFYGFVFQDTDFSKWIEAVAYSLCNHPDPELEKTADEAIEIVCAAQQENGYLDTYYIINGMDRVFTNLKDHHELYCLGHLVEGAVAYAQATGKEKLLKAACRYADYCVAYFGPGEGQRKGYPGHEIAEMALARLYEATGEWKYLELSAFFLEQRGKQPYYFDEESQKRAEYEEKQWKPDENPDRYAYYQAHLPVREQTEAVGHAVRAVYLYSGMADVARLTRDESMYQACLRLWDSIVSEKLYVTGGIGGTAHGEAFSYPFDLRNDQAYSETCAAVGLVFFARRMLEISAKSQYADAMERALYNTVLAGMALDGKSFFYVNPLEVVPKACRQDRRLAHVQPTRQKWFGCACCPPNIARLVSSVQAYAYTASEDVLYTHLYMGSELAVSVGGKEIKLTTETDMPWDGHFRMEVRLDAGEAFYMFAFRLPDWSKKTRVRVCGGGEQYALEINVDAVRWIATEKGEKLNGKERSLAEVSQKAEGKEAFPAEAFIKTEVKDGYLHLSGDWHDGDLVTLDFAMETHMVTANPQVRDDVGKVAFLRGPLTYCMEEADNGVDLHLYRADLDRIGAHCQGIETGMMEIAGHKMSVLEVPGLRMKERGGTEILPVGKKALNPETISAEKEPLYRETLSKEKQPLYRDYLPPVEESVSMTMIPYYAWANRGEGEMSVWVRI